MSTQGALPRLLVLMDPPDEEWRSMDLVGEQLVAQLDGQRKRIEAIPVRPSLPRLARRIPAIKGSREAWNFDRLVGRHVTYPGRALGLRSRGELFHVVDHTYAQLVHSLPVTRTGVYCHDIDAFRSLLPDGERRPAWYRALTRRTLRGLQSAAVVFHSTNAVRDELLQHRLVEPSKLVHAPYGVAPEYLQAPLPPTPRLEPVLEQPFLLHVGSAAPRKRLDVLFAVFERLSAAFPKLRLVQVGAGLEGEALTRLRGPLLPGRVSCPPRLEPSELTTLYAHAALVLVPSSAEGFGLPVIEALACGAPVVASDIPVLREVGGEVIDYCPVGDVAAWVDCCERRLRSPVGEDTRVRRVARGRAFSWKTHADIITASYLELLGGEHSGSTA